MTPDQEAPCVDALDAEREKVAALRAAAQTALHLVGNSLWNEDGESEEWLNEAYDAIRAALGDEP